jgi:hypothetical protein
MIENVITCPIISSNANLSLQFYEKWEQVLSVLDVYAAYCARFLSEINEIGSAVCLSFPTRVNKDGHTPGACYHLSIGISGVFRSYL